MWDIGYRNVLSDGVQNQLLVQSILKRGTFCQMGHWKSKEKFSLLLGFQGIESHDFSIPLLVVGGLSDLIFLKVYVVNIIITQALTLN